MATKNQNPIPRVLGEAPQVPPPFERNLLPDEQRGREKKQKLPKVSKSTQYKRTQKNKPANLRGKELVTISALALFLILKSLLSRFISLKRSQF